MSEPRTGTASHRLEDFEGVVVKHHRFGTRQAIVLSLIAFLGFVAVKVLFTPNYQDERLAWLEANQVAPVLEARATRPSSSEISAEAYDGTLGERRASTPQPLWAKREKLTEAAFELLADAGRILERKSVDKAFAELDLNDRRRVRAFLLTYGRSRHAHEQGYTQAIVRRGLEADLYRSGEIVPCDECWCWQSQPAHAGPPPLLD